MIWRQSSPIFWPGTLCAAIETCVGSLTVVEEYDDHTCGKGGKVERRARPPMPMGCPEMTRVPGMCGPCPSPVACMGAAGRWMYL